MTFPLPEKQTASRLLSYLFTRSWKDATGRTDNRVELTDGRISADQVSGSWKILVAPTGVTWTWAFTGKLEASGNAMKGVAMLSAGPGSKQNEVSFTATKQ